MTKPFHIALFASGNGTNARAILEYFHLHSEIEVSLVLSNNPQAYVLERAKNWNVETKVFDKVQFQDEALFMEWLKKNHITHIVLAGFLWLIPSYLIKHFPNCIINIHPALLPKFGGKGMFGRKVHEAVKLAAEKETGITIHLVNEKYDEGKVILQKSCGVMPSDSVDDIARKVHQLEHQYFPPAIESWILKKND
jgi:Folate-dependent phosphoribosylglycinamide formyltransferase PurN